MKLKLGEWKVLDTASGTNIQQNVFPLPTKEPSQTLFQLLGLLIQVGKDLISATDAMQGKGPAQNVPATTSLMQVEQGMRIYSAITKRLFRSLKAEFKKIFALNGKHLTNKEYLAVLDDEEADFRMDFSVDGYDICPVADPNMSSDVQRLAKAQAIIQTPGVSPFEASKYFLESLQLDKNVIERLMPEEMKQQPPPPEAQKAMAQAGLFQAQMQAILQQLHLDPLRFQAELAKSAADNELAQADATLKTASAQKMMIDSQNNTMKTAITKQKTENKTMVDLAKLKMHADSQNQSQKMDAVHALLEAQKLASGMEDSQGSKILELLKIVGDHHNATEDRKVDKNKPKSKE
jgi:hypothetical protein